MWNKFFEGTRQKNSVTLGKRVSFYLCLIIDGTKKKEATV
jgi:hypothetical protein